jgi:hypothetical protein
MLIWARAVCVVLPFGALAACAGAPPSDSEQANLAACTQSADAVYQADNYNGLARTSQNGLLYSATPNHVFDAQRLGTLDARNNQIKDCMENGNPEAPAVGGTPSITAPLPAPQIIGAQNPP